MASLLLQVLPGATTWQGPYQFRRALHQGRTDVMTMWEEVARQTRPEAEQWGDLRQAIKD